MKILLDTHIFLWFISGDIRLSTDVRDAIRDPDYVAWQYAVQKLLFPKKLCDRISSMLSDFGGMESKNNAIFGYARGDEFLSDAVFNAIIMNPDFVIADFGMNHITMNSQMIFPAFMYQHKMVALAAHHHIGNHIPISIRKIRIVLENFLQRLTPLVYGLICGFHWIISSVFESKTIMRKPGSSSNNCPASSLNNVSKVLRLTAR